MPRLTEKLIDSLRPDERDRIVFDETVPGFGVRVFRSGHKSYVIQYRMQKRSRRFTLGNCNVLTPLQARKKAQSLLAGCPRRQRSRTGAARRLRRAHRCGPRGTLLARPRFEEEKRLRGSPDLGEGHPARAGRHLVEAVTCSDIDKLHAGVGERAPIQANRVVATVVARQGKSDIGVI